MFSDKKINRGMVIEMLKCKLQGEPKDNGKFPHTKVTLPESCSCR